MLASASNMARRNDDDADVLSHLGPKLSKQLAKCRVTSRGNASGVTPRRANNGRVFGLRFRFLNLNFSLSSVEKCFKRQWDLESPRPTSFRRKPRHLRKAKRAQLIRQSN